MYLSLRSLRWGFLFLGQSSRMHLPEAIHRIFAREHKLHLLLPLSPQRPLVASVVIVHGVAHLEVTLTVRIHPQGIFMKVFGAVEKRDGTMKKRIIMALTRMFAVEKSPNLKAKGVFHKTCAAAHRQAHLPR